MQSLEKYPPRRIGLIGHSGAGKSTCLNNIYRISADAKEADMDNVFDTSRCPPLSEAKEWMISNGKRVFVVSNHFNMLKEIAVAREKSLHNDLFNQVYFVYLSTTIGEIEKRLLERDGYGKIRSEQNKQDALKGYSDIDKLFRRIQDKTIDTSGKTILSVTEEVIKLFDVI